MNGFGNLEKALNQLRKTPLLAIDGKYYNTAFRGSCERQFMNEISGKPRLPKGEFQGDNFFLIRENWKEFFGNFKSEEASR